MAQITAKIMSATVDSKGMAIITLEFDNDGFKWQKSYKQSQELIKAKEFKEMVASDIRKDLKIQDKLAELTPLIGNTFTFNI